VCELEPIDFAAVAQGFGIASWRIEDPKQCAATLQAALASPGPTLIEAVVDPDEPPLPPKIEPKQAPHFAEALAKGTPNAKRIALTAVADKVRELI
jgi:pyruvate dehydrogenase (quinone)/pyruvate oxidase